MSDYQSTVISAVAKRFDEHEVVEYRSSDGKWHKAVVRKVVPPKKVAPPDVSQDGPSTYKYIMSREFKKDQLVYVESKDRKQKFKAILRNDTHSNKSFGNEVDFVGNPAVREAAMNRAGSGLGSGTDIAANRISSISRSVQG